MKKLSIISILVCLFTMSYSQQTTWLFGPNAGLRFNGTNVTKLNTSSLDAGEGASVAHDNNGNLLFYTNGKKVFNANHVEQDLGLGPLGLGGDPSSTQCALIIPVYGKSCTQFFVFIVDQVESAVTTSSLTYNLPSVFLLEVNKNTNVVTRLAGPTVLFNEYSTEKLCATSDGNGGFWVLLHNWGFNNSTNFHAFHVTKTTTNLTQIVNSDVVTNIGGNHLLVANNQADRNYKVIAPMTTAPGTQLQETMQGQMQFSPDGTKVALAIPILNRMDCFNFDKATGTLSDIALGASNNFSMTRNQIVGFDEGPKFLYGLEFSADSKIIYISDGFSKPGSGNTNARVMSIRISDRSTINFVKVVDINQQGVTFGKMELGPDNKIYIARPSNSEEDPNTIDVMSDPNTFTNPQYQSAFSFPGISLGTCLPTIAANDADCRNTECKCYGTITDPLLYVPIGGPVGNVGNPSANAFDGNLSFKANSGGNEVRKIKVTLIKALLTGPAPCYQQRDITNELSLKTFTMSGFKRISNGKTVTFTKIGEGGTVLNNYLNIPVKWTPPISPAPVQCEYPPNISFCFEVELVTTSCNYCASEICSGPFPPGPDGIGDGTEVGAHTGIDGGIWPPDPDSSVGPEAPGGGGSPNGSPADGSNEDSQKNNTIEEIKNDNPGSNEGLNVFPNPTKNILNVKMNYEGIKMISIVSQDGKVVETINTSDKAISINTKKYNGGIYNIMVYHEGKVDTVKFVKEQTND